MAATPARRLTCRQVAPARLHIKVHALVGGGGVPLHCVQHAYNLHMSAEGVSEVSEV